MAIVRINPESKNRPYLKEGGLYGPGATHPADVVVFDFKAQVEPGEGPGFDRDCKDHDYAQLVFQVKSEEYGQSFARVFEPTEANSGSRLMGWLINLGVDITDDGEYDDETVVGQKGVVEVKAPRQDKNGKWWTGDVKDVLGV
jgi:hypothetical protein